MGVATTAHKPIYFDNFQDLIGFFYDSSYSACFIFDIEITGAESTKSKFPMIGCYSIGAIDIIYNFSRLTCVFAFIEATFQKYSKLSLYSIQSLSRFNS